eukprot:CAMPEP_0197238074 /NCGR_PEP_ID=MMETSP1429-20130617/4691_1 /TAXON_ID=49237 /ORGANISM="Chaetoceros  sp., Strain UNC1202" /LENGTH=114 /DNA_ID=CAMNT_0042697173 /DNA_START=28 /DNA_END=372 /DNA_ORIENTATION=-
MTLSTIIPIGYSVLYTLTILSIFPQDDDDGSSFTSLEGVTNLFKKPSNVFAGWIHYLAFDAFVGRWIVLDSVEHGVSMLFHFSVVVPCLFFTLMFGPMGLIMYLIARKMLNIAK